VLVASALLHCQVTGGQLGAVLRPELGEQRGEVALHGADREVGPVTVVTGILEATVEIDGRRQTGKIRTSAVFADDGGDWKIVHEHLSPLPPNP
jgi:ketosteroid isomerase-like protein